MNEKGIQMKSKIREIETEIETVRGILQQNAPCSLLDLAKLIKKQINTDLDNFRLVLQLKELVKKGLLNESFIVESKLSLSLTREQKLSVKEIVKEVERQDRKVTFCEMAKEIIKRTGKGDEERIVRALKFLFIPLYPKEEEENERY